MAHELLEGFLANETCVWVYWRGRTYTAFRRYWKRRYLYLL